jgi:hypothetical protein
VEISLRADLEVTGAVQEDEEEVLEVGERIADEIIFPATRTETVTSIGDR